ncbi:MAG TPA: hypothetical protein VLA19_06450 [Herpetosiphonaceae bacterium]|nr:hypothetical protein [Herpetosiphonaceae bacterium]
MRLPYEERAILEDIAHAVGVVPEHLMEAVEHESAQELAQVLGLDEREAAARLEPVLRAATVGDDWGAGCKLLTGEVRAELQAALRGLGPGAHSASLGVSHG